MSANGSQDHASHPPMSHDEAFVRGYLWDLAREENHVHRFTTSNKSDRPVLCSKLVISGLSIMVKPIVLVLDEAEITGRDITATIYARKGTLINVPANNPKVKVVLWSWAELRSWIERWLPR